MASSAKRSRTTILSEEKVRELLDTSADSNEGQLTDSEIDYSDSESEDDEDAVVIGASADASSDEDNSDDVRRVRHRRVRKNLLANLEDTINEINYDSLPPQAPKTFNYISSDKKTTYI